MKGNKLNFFLFLEMMFYVSIFSTSKLALRRCSLGTTQSSQPHRFVRSSSVMPPGRSPRRHKSSKAFLLVLRIWLTLASKLTFKLWNGCWSSFKFSLCIVIRTWRYNSQRVHCWSKGAKRLIAWGCPLSKVKRWWSSSVRISCLGVDGSSKFLSCSLS